MLPAAILVVVIGGLVWLFVSRRGNKGDQELGYGLVYVNQDGSMRELSPKEQAYTSEEFENYDSGRPYIKSNYKSVDGWGSQSGFMERRRVPKGLVVLPVHSNYDAREEEMGNDMFAAERAAGYIIQENGDGSTTVMPNPDIPIKEQVALVKQHVLQEQRTREALAKIP